ncbi:hypothetical protein J6590_044113 [Homalodisca vitripennis]|nr:hypothetical protein J6590_044113 [Homalodisca vitripennis]
MAGEGMQAPAVYWRKARATDNRLPVRRPGNGCWIYIQSETIHRQSEDYGGSLCNSGGPLIAIRRLPARSLQLLNKSAVGRKNTSIINKPGRSRDRSQQAVCKYTLTRTHTRARGSAGRAEQGRPLPSSVSLSLCVLLFLQGALLPHLLQIGIGFLPYFTRSASSRNTKPHCEPLCQGPCTRTGTGTGHITSTDPVVHGVHRGRRKPQQYGLYDP